MDGIQWACSDCIISKCSGHRLTLFAWCFAFFLLFLFLAHGNRMLSDKFIGQQYVSTTTLLPVSPVLSLWKSSISEPCPSLNQPRHTPSMPPKQPYSSSQGAEKKKRQQGGDFLSVQGRTVHIYLPAVCFPSLNGFHPLYCDAHGVSLAMFSCFASSTSRNPGRRWTT